MNKEQGAFTQEKMMEEYKNNTESSLRLLEQGDAPGPGTVLEQISYGQEVLTSFLEKQYLEEYIPSGGSKIKLVTGRRGAGKTHFSQEMLSRAQEKGYLTVSFSAKQVWLHDFREIYLEILRQCDIGKIVEGCAAQIIRSLGYEYEQIGKDRTFMDFLSENGEADALSKGEIRSALRSLFTKNPLLDNTFACCCSLLTGGVLGHPVLEPANRALLLAYMAGDKTVKLSQLRALGLSPSKITKYNARHMLRSLAETAHIGGFAGIIVVIDDMEMLLNRSASSPIHYGKVRRDDTYESIRQLIDDIDSMRYLMFFLCFDRELIEDENYGMKSYQALWMRVQNEVISARFNCFADIIDLDQYADQYYTSDVLCEMSRRLAQVFAGTGRELTVIDQETAEDLRERALYGGLGLPYLVNRRMLETETDGQKKGGEQNA